MPRSNHPRRQRSIPEHPDRDLSRALVEQSHTETKRGQLWNVQPISVRRATKIYLCPGCGLDIAQGTAHTVTWRADGPMGADEDLANRRHWHTHCWKIRT